MLDACRDILTSNDLCVLATQGPTAPHTSLMSYVSGPDQDALSFVTLQHTVKYTNICRTPLVSILVDTRLQHCSTGHSGNARSTLQALTIQGHAVELFGAERQAMLSFVQEKHPQVAAICTAPDAAVVMVRVLTYQLLTGALDAFHVRIREERDV